MSTIVGQHSFEERVHSLRQAHGDMIATRDIVEVVESMVSAMHVELRKSSDSIGTELNTIMNFITVAKLEIAAIRPHALSASEIPSATDELDAVVLHTEAAAGAIMDCADELVSIAAPLENDLKEKLQGLSTRIYEASSFQDITGQRVTKVVRLLKEIEIRLAQLAVVFGDTKISNINKYSSATGDEQLLNGPQLHQDIDTQQNIDALFDSIGS